MSQPIKVNLSNVSFLGRALDFVETYNFPQDLLLGVVQKPESRVMDPSSPEKGYPVVRCRRGDITVVLGIQNPEAPCIIHVWLHTPEDNELLGGTKKAGGASGSKLPGSVNQLKGYLQHEGCRLVNNGRGHTSVYYGDVMIGSIASTPHGRGIKNDYIKMRNRLAAERAKQELTSHTKES